MVLPLSALLTRQVASRPPEKSLSLGTRSPLPPPPPAPGTTVLLSVSEDLPFLDEENGITEYVVLCV